MGQDRQGVGRQGGVNPGTSKRRASNPPYGSLVNGNRWMR